MKDLSIRHLIHDVFVLFERAYVFVNVTFILSMSALLNLTFASGSRPLTATMLWITWGASQFFIYVANIQVRDRACYQLLVARRAVRYIFLLSGASMFLILMAFIPLAYLMASFPFLQEPLTSVGVGLARLLIYSMALVYACTGAIASTTISHYRLAHLNYRLAAGISYKVSNHNPNLILNARDYKQLTRFFERGLEAMNRYLWVHRYHHPQIKIRPLRERFMFILQFGDFLSRQRIFIGVQNSTSALKRRSETQFIYELGRMLAIAPEEIIMMHPSRKERIGAFIRQHEITISLVISIITSITAIITLMR